MISALDIAYIIWEAKSIEESIRELKTSISQFELMFIYIVPSEKLEFDNTKKEHIEIISKKIRNINKEISKFNTHIKRERYNEFWDLPKIKEINFKVIKLILKDVDYYKSNILNLLKKDSSEFKNKEIRKENFRIKINMCLVDTIKSLKDIILPFINITDKFKSDKLKKTKYEIPIQEINNIFGIGYPELALFVSGRILEKIIFDYMISLRKNKRIDKNIDEIRRMSAEDRLNYLKGKWISEKDYHKIQSIKFDRNIIAHYISKRDFLEAKKDAEADIKITINLIERIYLKIIKRQSKLIS